jgi:hypothetical protein
MTRQPPAVEANRQSREKLQDPVPIRGPGIIRQIDQEWRHMGARLKP